MITARKQSAGINLLPQEEFASSTLGRILGWLLSTFRIIVIITEIVVMAAFLSRFWLDAKSNDLNDLIRRNQAILATTTDFENDFRKLQEKLEAFSKISSLNVNSSGLIKKITSYLPSNVYLNSFQIINESIQIKGSSVSEAEISQFIVNLKSEPQFSEVKLVNIALGQDNKSLIIFNITIDISNKGGK